MTDSRKPADYNGMKSVGRGAPPISGDSRLREIRQIVAESQEFEKPAAQGSLKQTAILDDYVDHLVGWIIPANLKPFKLAVNAGNGIAGHVIDAVESAFITPGIPVEFVKIQHEPDRSFPNSIPNPLLPENRAATAKTVQTHGADTGITRDGDFDRCFLFDEKGSFIEGYYIVGLLAEAFLKKYPDEKIIHDPRLTWNTIDIVEKMGDTPIQSKTGHAFIKERIRKEDAIYGWEMSAHHYFRGFAYCDSGMIPWLSVSELVCKTGKPLSDLVNERVSSYTCSGEINYKVKDVQASIQTAKENFLTLEPPVDDTDGISHGFKDWRLNLRASNTEPLPRLSVESRGKPQTVEQRVAEIESLIKEIA